MPARQTRNVSLTPELENFIMATLAQGRYRSASEVIRAALRLLEKEQGGREPEASARLVAESAGHRAK